MSKQPDLSVAIIFKNEIRCLERCLRSIQPLKERISVEIVMADTGSTDGSRGIAEKYADIVFDFPWINDFAAARNAVLDRCSGRWYLILDADEWLDRNVDELVGFVTSDSVTEPGGAAKMYNYLSKELESYSEFIAVRLLRASARPRYKGAIHEVPVLEDGSKPTAQMLTRTILHHDGYVMLNDGSSEGREKRKRNIALLRKEVEKHPDELNVLTQFIESGDLESDVHEKLLHAIDLIKQKKPNWDKVGAVVLRHGIMLAYDHHYPEMQEWIDLQQKMFPTSFVTRVEMEYVYAAKALDAKEYEKVLQHGRAYQRGLAEFRASPANLDELIHVCIQATGDNSERMIQLGMVSAYIELSRFDEALAEFCTISFRTASVVQTKQAMGLFAQLYQQSTLDTSDALQYFWRGIQQEDPDSRRAQERKNVFLSGGVLLFDAKESKQDDNKADRDAWRMFLPIAGECMLGDAAKLTICRSADEAADLWDSIENIADLPDLAFCHALEIGCPFPRPGRTLTVELADTLAMKLRRIGDVLVDAAMAAPDTLQEPDAPGYGEHLLWARACVMVALRMCDWAGGGRDNSSLIRAFVRVETVFLPYCYAYNALRNPSYLPPMQRFALHLGNAFSALEPSAVSPDFKPAKAFNVREALSELKAAVVAAPDQKAVVDCILDDLLGGRI